MTGLIEFSVLLLAVARAGATAAQVASNGADSKGCGASRASESRRLYVKECRGEREPIMEVC